MGEANALWSGDTLAATRRWTEVEFDIPPQVSAVCRTVAVADLAVGGWAMVVLGMNWSCTGPVCAATTLGGRPGLLLAWTMACVLAAAVLASVTGGMVHAGPGRLAALTFTTTLGAAAAFGAVVVLLVGGFVVATAVDLLLTAIERM